MARAQAIGDAVATWLPDHIGFDHFASNYTQSVSLATTSLTGLVYAPCIISNLPTGAAISATGIAISPLGVYITPEGANIQPEGFKARPAVLHPHTHPATRTPVHASADTCSVSRSWLSQPMVT